MQVRRWGLCIQHVCQCLSVCKISKGCQGKKLLYLYRYLWKRIIKATIINGIEEMLIAKEIRESEFRRLLAD
jgi:hypothetical protein